MVPGIYASFWNPNSNPHACMARALATEQSPSSADLFLNTTKAIVLKERKNWEWGWLNSEPDVCMSHLFSFLNSLVQNESGGLEMPVCVLDTPPIEE